MTGTLLVLVIHGGAFVAGSPATMAVQASDLQRIAPSAEVRSVGYTLGSPDVAYRELRRVARRHPGPVVAYGFSAGGYLATRLAANRDVTAAVSVAGLYDLEGFARRIDGDAMARAILGVATPAGRRSVRLRPRRDAAPALLVHGDSDPTAPIAAARRYARAHRSVRLVTLRGVRHTQPRRRVLRAMRWLIRRGE